MVVALRVFRVFMGTMRISFEKARSKLGNVICCMYVCRIWGIAYNSNDRITSSSNFNIFFGYLKDK